MRYVTCDNYDQLLICSLLIYLTRTCVIMVSGQLVNWLLLYCMRACRHSNRLVYIPIIHQVRT